MPIYTSTSMPKKPNNDKKPKKAKVAKQTKIAPQKPAKKEKPIHLRNKKTITFNFSLLVGIVSTILLLFVLFPIIPIIRECIVGALGLFCYPLFIIGAFAGFYIAKVKKVTLHKKYILLLTLSMISLLCIIQLVLTQNFDHSSYASFLSDTFASTMTAGGVIISLLIYPVYSLITVSGAYLLFAMMLSIFISLFIDHVVRSRLFGSTATEYHFLDEKKDEVSSVTIGAKLEEQEKQAAEIKQSLESQNEKIISSNMNFAEYERENSSRPDYKKEYIMTPVDINDRDDDIFISSENINAVPPIRNNAAESLKSYNIQKTQNQFGATANDNYKSNLSSESGIVNGEYTAENHNYPQNFKNTVDKNAYDYNKAFDNTKDNAENKYNSTFKNAENVNYLNETDNKNIDIENDKHGNSEIIGGEKTEGEKYEEANIGGEWKNNYNSDDEQNSKQNINNEVENFDKNKNDINVNNTTHNITADDSFNQPADRDDIDNTGRYNIKKLDAENNFNNNDINSNAADNNSHTNYSNNIQSSNSYDLKNNSYSETNNNSFGNINGAAEPQIQNKLPRAPYIRPVMRLLEFLPTVEPISSDDINARIDSLENALETFKVPAKVIAVQKGPAVTRYELAMPAGISVKKITMHADDIAMVLASNGAVRIEAPIPGKNAVGIEVPNEKVSPVSLREIFDTNQFLSSSSPLNIALGKDINGEIQFAPLDKLVHLIVAGSTGSGKSVMLNAMILNLIYKASPEQLRIILIDPKRVEFSKYEGLPHLLLPNIITEREHAINALKWAEAEMERRYSILQTNRVVNLKDYQALEGVKDGRLENLPYIIVIIDELADLMNENKKEIEDKLRSLAQKARASGIHLVVATQRPSVDVITGTIKANFPSRIAFALTNFADSKTVIDGSGAEKLLGKGDMLYKAYDKPNPTRVQGAFVSGDEVDAVVAYVKEHNTSIYDTNIATAILKKKDSYQGGDSISGELDPLARNVLQLFLDTGMTSANMIQTRFGVGFPRASRIISQLEYRKFISHPEGNKPRKILITRDDLDNIFRD